MVHEKRIGLNERFCKALAQLEKHKVVKRYARGNDFTYTTLANILYPDTKGGNALLSQHVNNDSPIDFPAAITFAEYFYVNRDWLIFGEGKEPVLATTNIDKLKWV